MLISKKNVSFKFHPIGETRQNKGALADQPVTGQPGQSRRLAVDVQGLDIPCAHAVSLMGMACRRESPG
jgi:hypothetical protein